MVGNLPRAVPFLAVGGVLVAGLLVQGVVGAVLLLVLAAGLGSLLLLSWPALQPQSRGLRAIVVGAVVVRALSFLL